MVTTAFIMALLLTGGFVVLFYKLPPWLQKFLSKRYILLDVLICIVVFYTIGFAIVGLMAAGFISIFVSGYLLWYKKKHTNEDLQSKTTRSYNCQTHIHLIAQCYNWFRSKRSI